MQPDLKKGERFFPMRSVLSLCLLGITAPNAFAEQITETNEVIFHLEALKTRGVDQKVAEWFRYAPQFMPGLETVKLSVNGKSKGNLQVTFDEKGQLCANAEFIKHAGLIMPDDLYENATCADLNILFPRSELKLDPAEGRVALVVPPEEVEKPGAENGDWQHGGVAGMMNYEAQYMDSLNSSSSTNFMQLGSEIGLNFSDWIVRSNQTYSRLNGETSMQHQSAYAQRSFAESKRVVQVGQISLSNSLLGAGQVLGVQVFPEAALQGDGGGPGLVEGIADSQSVVEVRQSGVLVHSTTVPAGPFKLQGFQLLNTRSDLSVTLTGSDGSVRNFIVPASALLLNGHAVAPGLTFGVGKVDQDGDTEEPVVATIGDGWMLNPHNTLNMGALGSSLYSALAVSLDSQPFDSTLLSLQTTASRDKNHDESGVVVVASASYQLTERVSTNVNVSQQTKGHRELSDALQEEPLDNDENIRNQFGLGINWSEETVGNLSLSFSRSQSFSGSNTNYVRGGWSKQIGNVYVGASIEHDTGTDESESDTRFYLNLSIPLGKGRSVSSYYNNSNTSHRAGVRYSERVSQDRGWSISSEQDIENKQTSGSAYVDMVTPVSQLNGSVNYQPENTSFSARASGGMVAHSGGVTLSPYRVSDTFGVAKVGKEAGVRLETPAGPTWTDSNGYAVLPALSGYKRSTIQVDTRSLPKNVDINNAWHETEAARGSVNYVNFDVVRTRRFLVDVMDALGQPLPHAAGVFDQAGSFVTVVGDKGSVFIPDISVGNTFDVQVSGKTICSFKVRVPEKIEANTLYETAKAECR